MLSKYDIDISWDYSDDLKNQYINVCSDMEDIDWQYIAKDRIANIGEIISDNVCFQTGYRGFIQTLILRVLSEKMKESDDKSYFN